MRNLILLLHLAAAILWMGGMAFLVLALRPAVHQHLQPPARVPLMMDVLRRFFLVVVASIAVLLASGLVLLQQAAGAVPPGWHAMAALGIVMMLVFAYIWFVPWRQARAALAAGDIPATGAALQRITLLAKFNLGLGWVAIAAATLWR